MAELFLVNGDMSAWLYTGELALNELNCVYIVHAMPSNCRCAVASSVVLKAVAFLFAVSISSSF